MPRAAGQSLSFHEILGPLRIAGMGEVHRVIDTRSEREAKTLASDNHSNLAHVCGLDKIETTSFISIVLRDLTNNGTARLASDR